MDIRIRLSKTDADLLTVAANLNGETLSGFIFKAAMERAALNRTGDVRRALSFEMTMTLHEAGFPARLIRALRRHMSTEELGRDVTIADYCAIPEYELLALPNVGYAALAKAKMILAIKFGY